LRIPQLELFDFVDATNMSSPDAMHMHRLAVTFDGKDLFGMAPEERSRAGLFLAFFWLYNIVDAGRRALLYNEALAGRSGVALPEDFKTPALQGSIPGGLAIVAVGGVLLSHTRFGFPLDWVSEWWPAALILFGVYLVARSVMSRSQAIAKP
jgi:hypothetical protein